MRLPPAPIRPEKHLHAIGYSYWRRSLKPCRNEAWISSWCVYVGEQICGTICYSCIVDNICSPWNAEPLHRPPFRYSSNARCLVTLWRKSLQWLPGKEEEAAAVDCISVAQLCSGSVWHVEQACVEAQGMGSIQSRCRKTGYDDGELQLAHGQTGCTGKQKAKRHSLDHAVCPLDKWSDIEIRTAFDGTRVLMKEGLWLQQAVEEAGEWQPVEMRSSDILDDTTTAMQPYRFLKGFKVACPVAIYRYAVGGSVGTVAFVRKLPAELSQSTCVTKCNAVVEQLKPRIPQYHTRQMWHTFAEQCSNLVRISPSVRRYFYTCLTGDSTAASSVVERDVDHCMRLVVLGKLPELSADLCHLATGRPGMFDVFLAAAQEIIRDSFVAEDDRRHGIAHMSHFISQWDLQKQAAERCPPGTPIPSVD